MRLLLAFLIVLPTARELYPQGVVPAWKLVAARDSFVVNVQGRSMGFTVLAVEALANGGFRVTENTLIGSMVDQQTKIMLDSRQRITSVVQSGKMRGQPTRIDLHYHAGHVQGIAQLPGPGGVESHNVDTSVPAGVIDDNLVQSLLAALPWSAEAQWVLPVFSGGKNELFAMQLTVKASEPLQLRGGSIAAFRAELRGGPAPVTVWVSRTKPHRLLKLSVEGSPMELVRAN